jgi:hypothetical protein
MLDDSDTTRRHKKRSSFRKNNKECTERCRTEERFASKGGVWNRQQERVAATLWFERRTDFNSTARNYRRLGSESEGNAPNSVRRGFLDPSKIVNRDMSKITENAVDGRNDAFGNLLPETSLKHHMAQLSDFQDEETLMQHHGKSLGVKVDQTPKCHPEMAGEEAEHSWAGAKGFHCRLPLSEKKSKAKLGEPVSRCVDSEQVLTAARQQRFSTGARECMVA